MGFADDLLDDGVWKSDCALMDQQLWLQPAGQCKHRCAKQGPLASETLLLAHARPILANAAAHHPEVHVGVAKAVDVNLQTEYKMACLTVDVSDILAPCAVQ